MFKINAKRDTIGDMAFTLTIEAKGSMSDIKKELKTGLYYMYKQFYDINGITALHEVCEATKEAMVDVGREVFS